MEFRVSRTAETRVPYRFRSDLDEFKCAVLRVISDRPRPGARLERWGGNYFDGDVISGNTVIAEKRRLYISINWKIIGTR